MERVLAERSAAELAVQLAGSKVVYSVDQKAEKTELVWAGLMAGDSAASMAANLANVLVARSAAAKVD